MILQERKGLVRTALVDSQVKNFLKAFELLFVEICNVCM